MIKFTVLPCFCKCYFSSTLVFQDGKCPKQKSLDFSFQLQSYSWEQAQREWRSFLENQNSSSPPATRVNTPTPQNMAS